MVVGAYYPELAGGSLQCRTLVHALRDRVRFSILTTTGERGLPRRSEVDGVPVHRVFLDPRSTASKAIGALELLGRMPSLALHHDIFHFHGFTEKMLLLLAAARISGRRTVDKLTSVGWDDPIAIRSRPLGAALAAGVRAVDRLIAISPAMRDRCLGGGVPADRVVEIPNGVDTGRFAPVDRTEREALRARLGVPRDTTLVTFVGFWSREKGPDVLFEAWRRARLTGGVDTTLLFIGSTVSDHAEVDSGMVAAVRAQIEAEGLASSVLFVERTDEVSSYLQASDIFAVPSSREGLSNAVLEAMSTGLPCVVGAIPGVSDAVIASGDNGFIVPLADADALHVVLTRLLSSESERASVGRHARETILGRFGIDAVADRYFTVYAQLLDS